MIRTIIMNNASFFPLLSKGLCLTLAKKMRAFIFICLAILSLEIHAGIIINDSGSQIELSNDEVSLTIDKARARITKLSQEGKSILAPGQTGYFTLIAEDKGAPSVIHRIENCEFNIHLLTENTVDLSFRPEKPEGFPFEMDLHFVLRDGESGYYFYVVASKEAGTPDATITQFRHAIRLDYSMINAHLNDERQGTVLSTEEIQNALGKVMDATYMLENGEFRTKYEWSSPTGEAPVYGLHNETQGVWMIRGGSEYLNGGPTKQHNTCHGTDKGPIVLNLLYSNHYGSMGSYVSGEWTKIFGPTFVYLNQSGDPNSLWHDAKIQETKMRKAWPYDWMDHPEFPVDRASVSGQFPNIDTGWVVLARPYEFRGLDWQQQGGDSYTYRSRIRKDGSFLIPAVREGTYSLYAFAPGIVGEYRKDHIEVDSTAETLLGKLPWKSRSYGKVLWRIGEPDRRAEEFRHGDDYHHWGLWLEYPEDFPDDVDFIVGQSKERTDWNYAHMIMWMEEGGWRPKLDQNTGEGEWREPVWKIRFPVDDTIAGFAHLTIGLAGVSRDTELQLYLNGNPLVSYELISSDGCIHRSGISGFYRERILTFDASLLDIGENTLSLELNVLEKPNRRTNYSFGIMYDFLQLEVEQDLTSTHTAPGNAIFSLYPNPATDILFARLPQDITNGQLQLINMAGQTVLSRALNEDQIRIKVRGLPAGIYTAVFEADGKVYSTRVCIS